MVLAFRDYEESLVLDETKKVFVCDQTETNNCEGEEERALHDDFKSRRLETSSGEFKLQQTDDETVLSSWNSSRSSSFSSTPKSVSFASVRVREHCVIIGDSLHCKVLPLSLGWSYAAETTYDVNAYEHKKEQRRSFAQERQQSQRLVKLDFAERLNVLTTVSGMKCADIMWLDRQRRYSNALR
jgi:hypothetical protein